MMTINWKKLDRNTAKTIIINRMMTKILWLVIEGDMFETEKGDEK